MTDKENDACEVCEAVFAQKLSCPLTGEEMYLCRDCYEERTKDKKYGVMNSIIKGW